MNNKTRKEFKMETTLTGILVTDQQGFKYLEIKKGLLYHSLSSGNILITSPRPPANANTEYLNFGKNKEYEVIASVKIDPPSDDYIRIQTASADIVGRYDKNENSVWETFTAGDGYKSTLLNLIQKMNNGEYSPENQWIRLKQGNTIINL